MYMPARCRRYELGERLMKHKLTRRTFLAGAGAAASSLALGRVSANPKALRVSPLEKLNIAGIGVGGRGAVNLDEVSSENIVALCDVDDERARTGGAPDRWPDAKQYRDFRKMFDEMANEIDAAVISTPDHTHAVIALAAMQLGIHVYVEKPLSHSIKEARAMRDAARKYGVVTQMGNQYMASDWERQMCERIWSGAIGQFHTAHIWGPWPTEWWPGGKERPDDTPSAPEHLDWDLWLGPAQQRPYSWVYAPGLWRGWSNFGTGALGDAAIHRNEFFMILRPRQPESVEVVRKKGMTDETYPDSSVIRYEFPAQYGTDRLTLYWYDGGEKPAPQDLPDYVPPGILEKENGTVYVGTDGAICDGQLHPEERREEYDHPVEMLPRSPGHHQEFIQACKGGPPPFSNFDYAAPATEIVLLGNVALRAGEKIEWDGEKVTNIDAANEYLHREYRDGWSLT